MNGVVKEEIDLFAPSSNSNDTDTKKGILTLTSDKSKNLYRRVSFNETITCFTCRSTFRLQNLKDHLELHAGPETFSCDFCQKQFYRRDKLKSHLIFHTGERKHQCLQCDKRFFTKWHLKDHLRTHSGSRPYGCAHCESRFVQRSNLLNHLTKIHAPKSSRPLASTKLKTFTCKVCTNGFSRMRELVQHFKKCQKFQCHFCAKSFDKKLHIKHHMRKCVQRPYSCSHCGKTFTQINALRIHRLIHVPDNEKPYSCAQCGKRYCNKQHLQLHVWAHLPHNERPYRCDKCDVGCVTKRRLDDHFMTHGIFKTFSAANVKVTNVDQVIAEITPTKKEVEDDKERFYCKICEKGFNKEYKIRLHNLAHELALRTYDGVDINTRVKHENIGKNGRYLSNHDNAVPSTSGTGTTSEMDAGSTNEHSDTSILIDTEGYKCPLCEMVCVTKQYLQVHVRMHKKHTVSYKCNVCPMVCVTKRHLHAHVLSHKTLKPGMVPDALRSTPKVREVKCIQNDHESHRKYYCEKCKRCFKKTYQFELHQIGHDLARRFGRDCKTGRS